MEFNLSGKITLDDFVRFNKFYLKYILFKGWRKIIFPSSLIIIACAIIASRNYYLMIGIFMFIIVFYILLKKNLKKQYYSNKFYMEEQHFFITKDQIEIKSENAYVSITKDKINEILYNKDAIYVFISSYLAYVMPKTFLHDNNFDLLKDFIKEHYKKLK